MLTEAARQFAEQNSKAVLTTFRKSGAAQMSVVMCTPVGDGVSLTTPDDRAKLKNLARDPRCSLLVAQDDWWGYVVIEGSARIDTVETLGRDEFLTACRQIFRQISGEHSDWNEYDQAMIDERRAIVTVVPDRVYGTGI
jgi:PPOX class probable F420-dependent enzyme